MAIARYDFNKSMTTQIIDGKKLRDQILEKVKKEIDKQMKLISDLLQRYKKNLTNPELFRDALKQRAEKLAFDPKKESSVLKYAEGQTDLFEKVFTDNDILAIVDKKEDEIFGRFFEKTLKVYPNYFSKQQDEKKKFEMEQAEEVLEQKASAALYLYIAGGKFLTFLLISLILVLVKIERNLRVRPV